MQGLEKKLTHLDLLSMVSLNIKSVLNINHSFILSHLFI